MAAAAAAAAEKATGASKNSLYKTFSTGRILLIGKRRREGRSRIGGCTLVALPWSKNGIDSTDVAYSSEMIRQICSSSISLVVAVSYQQAQDHTTSLMVVAIIPDTEDESDLKAWIVRWGRSRNIT